MSDSERDKDWILAIGHALGLNSGFEIPIVPETEPFRRLFDAVKERELLALRERHREARQWMKHTSECASIKRRFDRVPFGEKARATYYESLRCTCGLDAFLAAEQPAQEKVAP